MFKSDNQLSAEKIEIEQTMTEIIREFTHPEHVLEKVTQTRKRRNQ